MLLDLQSLYFHVCTTYCDLNLPRFSGLQPASHWVFCMSSGPATCHSAPPGPTKAERLWEATARGTAGTGAPVCWLRWLRNFEMLSYFRFENSTVDYTWKINRFWILYLKLNTFAWHFQPWRSATFDLGWSPFRRSYRTSFAIKNRGRNGRTSLVSCDSPTLAALVRQVTSESGSGRLQGIPEHKSRQEIQEPTPPFGSAICLISRTLCALCTCLDMRRPCNSTIIQGQSSTPRFERINALMRS